VALRAAYASLEKIFGSADSFFLSAMVELVPFMIRVLLPL
jgi:hypothetical protein